MQEPRKSEQMGGGTMAVATEMWKFAVLRFLRVKSFVILFAATVLCAGQAVAQMAFEPFSTLNSTAASDDGDDTSIQIATDTEGNWVAVWSSNDVSIGGGGPGSETDIAVAISSDNGATWSATVALNSNAATDSGSDTFPAIATDRAGNWLVTWVSRENIDVFFEGTVVGSAGDDRDIFVSLSTDNGQSWTPPAVLNNNAGIDIGTDGNANGGPQIATDAMGTWITVWHSTEDIGQLCIGTDGDILYAVSINNGLDWTIPTNLNTNAGTDSGTVPDDDLPQVTTDGLGNWVTIWSSGENLGGTIGEDRDIFWAVSTDAGASWSAPVVVDSNASSDQADDNYPQLATDGAGNWLAVWESDDPGPGVTSKGDLVAHVLFWLVGVSTSSSGGFVPPEGGSKATKLADSDKNTRPHVVTGEPVLISDSSISVGPVAPVGNFVLTFNKAAPLSSGGFGDADVITARVQVRDGALIIGPLGVVNTNALTDSVGDNDTNPRLGTDGKGHWIAVWESTGTLEETIGSDSDILFATTTDPIFWSLAAPLHANAATDAGTDESPHLATDGAGNWVTVWTSSDTAFGGGGPDPKELELTSESDIVVASSADNGATWSDPAALNSNSMTDTGLDTEARLATNGAGQWVAIWTSSEPAFGGGGPPQEFFVSETDILVARSNNNGVTWSAPAALHSNAMTDENYDFYPDIATDGLGNWVAVWASGGFFGGYEILASRSVDDGASWSAPVSIQTNSDPFADPFLGETRIATDGQGNWVAVWTLNVGQLVTETDILYSRSTDNGATWTPHAFLNSDAETDEADKFDRNPQIATDGAENWVVSWLAGTVVLFGDDPIGGLAASSSDGGATWSDAVEIPGLPWPTGIETPSLTTDRAGNWVAASGGSASRSVDNGASWSFAGQLTANAKLSTQIGFGASNRWVVVSSTDDTLGETLGSDRDILFATATPGAMATPTPTPTPTPTATATPTPTPTPSPTPVDSRVGRSWSRYDF